MASLDDKDNTSLGEIYVNLSFFPVAIFLTHTVTQGHYKTCSVSVYKSS